MSQKEHKNYAYEFELLCGLIISIGIISFIIFIWSITQDKINEDWRVSYEEFEQWQFDKELAPLRLKILKNIRGIQRSTIEMKGEGLLGPTGTIEEIYNRWYGPKDFSEQNTNLVLKRVFSLLIFIGSSILLIYLIIKEKRKKKEKRILI